MNSALQKLSLNPQHLMRLWLLVIAGTLCGCGGGGGNEASTSSSTSGLTSVDETGTVTARSVAAAEVSPAPPPPVRELQPSTWVVIGSSSAAGAGASPGKSWASLIQASVQGQLVQIANIARGGTVTYQGLSIWREQRIGAAGFLYSTK